MKSFCLLLTIFMGIAINIDYSTGIHTKISALKNRHLVVAAAELPVSLKIKRNSTGHIVELGGVAPLYMKWLSRRFKFKYTILDFNASTIEDRGPNIPGFLYYVLRGECDVIMIPIHPTSERNRYLDFVHSCMDTPVAILIPMPDLFRNQINFDAVIKPFDLWVWMGLILSVLAVMITLCCFNQCQRGEIIATNIQVNNSINLFKRDIRNVSMYVIGTLLNQGGHIHSKTIIIRFVIGGWCLSAFVLLNTYNGTLISYVTATTNSQPLVNSIDDVLANHDINLVVDKGKGPDVLFSSADRGIYKGLGDKLRSYSNSRCDSTQQCIDLVKSSSQPHVYIHVLSVLKYIIREEHLKTGKCQLSISSGGQGFIGTRALGWVLAKNSPYLKEFNLGFSMLRDVGLISFWEDELIKTRPCFDDVNTRRQASQNTKPLVRLTLKNLAGAFALLGIGSVISFLFFLMETILFRCF